MRALLGGIGARLEAADARIAALTDAAANADAMAKSSGARDSSAACEMLLHAGDSAGARIAYEALGTAVGELENLLEPAIDSARERFHPPEPKFAVSSLGGALLRETAMFAGTPARRILPASELNAQIQRGEWKIAVIGFVIAVVTGARILWLANPAWGDLNDMLSAVLWGLGVHQVTGVFLGQFDFAALIARITGTKAPG